MVNRRAFIKRCFALYGSLLLMPACKKEMGRQQYRCFSIDESECLGAICEQFIPTDEYLGAKEAGVVNFIDKLLYQRFPELEPDYKKGIQALEKYSMDVFQKTFANLSWEQQYTVLQQMERKELPETYWEEIPQKNFLIWFCVIRCKGIMVLLGMGVIEIM